MSKPHKCCSFVSSFISRSDHFSSRECKFLRFLLEPLHSSKSQMAIFTPFWISRDSTDFCEMQKFRLELLCSVAVCLQQGDFQASMDIKDAYLHVPIFTPHQKFLWSVVDDCHFQFVALPFGLSTASRVVTKVLAPVLGILRTRGIISILGYLDNLLLWEQTASLLETNVF